MRRVFLVVAGILLASACGGAVPVSFASIPTINGKVNANFDVVEIDQVAHRLYVADRTDSGVDVFDISAARPKFLTTVALPSPPNGLAVAPDLARLYAGTGSGSVFVIDVNNDSNAIVAEVKTGKPGVDLIEYAAPRQRLYASNSSDGSITSIDTTTNTIKVNWKIGTVALEQPRFNPGDGMLYVTSPTADMLYRIDPNDGMLTSFPLGGCGPTGLAINPQSNQAVIICHTFVITWDLKAGKTIARFNQVLGGDVASYDAKVDRFFVASPHLSKPSVVAIFGGNPIEYVTSVDTGAHGNAAAFDEKNGVVYTPDPRLKRPGIAGFQLSATPQLLPRWLEPIAAVGPIVAAVVLFLVLFVFLVRSADPARRPIPKPKPKPKPEPEAAEPQARSA